jgi:tetratricopeptide (TPR) repeat protein
MYKIIFLAFNLLLYLFMGKTDAASLYDTLQRGNKLYREGKFDEALKTYIEGQIENAGDANLRYNIASSHYKMKNYEEALKGYLDVAATAPHEKLQEKALYGCGNALFRQGKLEQAIEYYQKALDLDPQDQDAQHNLEFAREELKRRINEAQETAKKQQEQKQKQDQEEKQQEQNQQKDQQKNQGQQQDQNKLQEKKQQQQGQKPEEQKETSRQEQKEQQSQAGEQKPEEQPQTQGQLSSAKNEQGDKVERGQVLPQQVRPMTKEEADQWLNSIKENRDKFAKKKTQENIAGQYRPDKDW